MRYNNISCEEIIDAYDHCNNYACIGCPLRYDGECLVHLREYTPVILKRQNAEIEMLNEQERILISQLAEERDKAIKEFAERLKAEIRDVMFAYTASKHCERIDNLVKTMVGDGK